MIRDVPIDAISPGENDRTVFDQAGLDELAASIKEHGLASPIVLRLWAPYPMCCFGGDRLGPGAMYQIVAGERRYRACKLLGWTSIPANVLELSDEQASAIMLTENVSRKDLDPVDEALAYKKRLDQFGWSVPEIAKKCGVSAERITRRLKLCSIRQDILHLVRSGQFPVGHAEVLSVLDVNRQIIAARPLIEGQTINLRQFRALVDQLFTEQSQESMFDLALFGGTLESGAVGPFKAVAAVYPISTHLPPPQLPDEHHAGAIIWQYIQDLMSQGFDSEAATLGTLLKFLDEHNYARVPSIIDHPALTSVRLNG